MPRQRTKVASVWLGVALALLLAGFVGYWVTGLAMLYEVPCVREHRGCERWELYRVVGPALLLASLVAMTGLLVTALCARVAAAWRRGREGRASKRHGPTEG